MRTSSGSIACLPRRALQPVKNNPTLDLSQTLLSPQARDALTALSNNASYSSNLNSDDILRALNAGVSFDADDVAADERPPVAREPSLIDWMREELNLGATWPARVAVPKPVGSVDLALEFLTPQARAALTALSMIERNFESPPLDSDDILAALNAGSGQNVARRAFGCSTRTDRTNARDTVPFEALLSPRAREALTAIARGKRRSPDADELLAILNGVETTASDEDETGNPSMRDLLSSHEWQSDGYDYDDTEFTDALGRTAPPTPESQWQSENDSVSEESQDASEDADEMTGNRQFEDAWAARLMREAIMDECDAIDDILMNMEACSQWPLAVVDDTEPAWVGDLLGEFFTVPATRFDDCDEARFSATHVQHEECPSVVHQSSYDIPVPSLLGVLEGECTFEEYWTTSPPLMTTLPLLFGYQGMNESEEYYESGSKDGSWGWDQENWEYASLEYI